MDDTQLKLELARWTARLAVAAWVFWVVLALAGRGTVVRRGAWTAALGVYLVHVAWAFAHHGFSHAAAERATAERTAELIGVAWGGGLWFNYVFTLVWIADVAWWWIDRSGRERARRWATGVHVGFAVMFINATLVFGPRGWWPAAVVAGVILAVAWKRGRSIARDQPAEQVE